jgi:hypothetical protein
MCIGYGLLRTGASGGILWQYGYELFWQSEQLSASQGLLCSMESVVFHETFQAEGISNMYAYIFSGRFIIWK